MFKKDLSPGAKSKVKSSVQRAIRSKVVETYPALAPYVDEIMPKKGGQMDVMKLPDRLSLYLLSNQPLFWQHMDDPLIPHLKLVHAFPHCFPSLGIDRGAIRFVLSGAALMAPGLTSAGGWLPEGDSQDEDQNQEGAGAGGAVVVVDALGRAARPMRQGEVVAIRAEGKDEVCLVGRLKVGTDEIKRVGKGVVMDGGHYLGDGLWRLVLE